MLLFHKGLTVALAALQIAPMAAAQVPVAPNQAKVTPIEIVLVEAETVTPAAVSQWRQERFKAVAVVLNEQTGEARYRELARRISDGGLDLYCWIEVARDPKLAAAHPRWMAALGSHEDWQKNFKNFPEPGVGEVAKAFPWVPIGYREAFDAHLALPRLDVRGVGEDPNAPPRRKRRRGAVFVRWGSRPGPQGRITPISVTFSTRDRS